jgi:Gram-negative bacterial TonB protein C-terminal
MRHRHLWHFQVISTILALSLLPSISAQESKQPPPQAPTTTLQPTDSQSTALAAAPTEAAPLQELTARLLDHAEDAGCHIGDCKILVLNFALPDGNTSRYSMQLADQLSLEIAKQENSIKVIDRSLLQGLLQRDRIPSRLQNSEPIARWLGKESNANIVLVGTTKRIGKNTVQLSARLLSVKDKNRIGPSAEVNLSVDDVIVDLYPTNGLPSLSTITTTPNGENLRRAGVNGVSSPSCFFMPNPPYTWEAQSAKFAGVILLEGIVDTNGDIKEPRIVVGAPYGLDESAIKSMYTWKCHPATYSGKPVPVLVSFEVNFRLH